MNYNQFAMENQAPSTWSIAGVACATTLVVAAATYSLTASQADASLYAPAAVRVASRVAPVAQAQPRSALYAATEAQVNEAVVAESNVAAMNFAPAGNKSMLIASFSAMALAVASALAAAFGYRSDAIAMASGSGKISAAKGGAARGAQIGVGYKGSTQPGSAPTRRDGKPGYVYKLGLKNGRGNVDEYSPIYEPKEWKSDGDVYEPGTTGILLWAAGFLALLGTSAFLIYTTSQL